MDPKFRASLPAWPEINEECKKLIRLYEWMHEEDKGALVDMKDRGWWVLELAGLNME